jgi:Domain of unknown function (DUF6504)
MSTTEFVSEPISPVGGPADLMAMGKGEPGLPSRFAWRGEEFEIVQRLETWKHSEREGVRSAGELYLRRHYYRLNMSNGSNWTVYFTRQPLRSGPSKARWFLYEIDRE